MRSVIASLLTAFLVGCGKDTPTTPTTSPQPKATPPKTIVSRTKPTPNRTKPVENASWEQVRTRFEQLIKERLASSRLAFEKRIPRLSENDRTYAQQSIDYIFKNGIYGGPLVEEAYKIGADDCIRAIAVDSVAIQAEDRAWMPLLSKIWSKRNPVACTKETLEREAEWLFSVSVPVGLMDPMLRPLLYDAIDAVLKEKKPGPVPGEASSVFKSIIREIP